MHSYRPRVEKFLGDNLGEPYVQRFQEKGREALEEIIQELFDGKITLGKVQPPQKRSRLKASSDISDYSPAMQVILRALKRYGMILADNGSNWYVSGAPDPRWSDDELRGLKTLRGSDFEVVRMGTIVTQ
jgi:hypothetical protein